MQFQVLYNCTKRTAQKSSADVKMTQECWVTQEVQAQHEFHFKCLQ